MRLLIEEFNCKLKYILEKEKKTTDTISRIYAICNESTMHSDDIFYNELHDVNFNNIMLDIIFLDNFLRENIDIFEYDCPLEYKVISNYQ